MVRTGEKPSIRGPMPGQLAILTNPRDPLGNQQKNGEGKKIEGKEGLPPVRHPLNCPNINGE
jgi:hypothetical protein